MPHLRPYGVGAAFETALIDGAADPFGVILESGVSFAAGDAKVSSDQQGLTNLTAEYGTFTSGDTEPQPGDSITGVTSTETAVVVGVFLTSGSWSGGDAAGYLFVEQVSGAWQNEVVNNTTQSDADSMTLAADFTPSVGIVATGTRVFYGLTSTEMSCRCAIVQIQDQAATVWASTCERIETYGNGSAQHAIDLDDSVRAGLTALPNAAADAAGGLPISDAGGLDLDTVLDAAVSSRSSHSAADVVDNFETQSQADPTGFHVNVLEVNGTAQTAGDLAALITTVDDFLDTEIAAILAAVDTEVADILADTNELQTDWANGGRLDLLIDAIKAITDAIPDSGAMTSIAQASVLGAIDDAAAAGDPTASDTLVAYVKQLINVLVGSTGIGTFPASAAPANAVSIAEVLRAIYDDTNELQGDDIPGTLSSMDTKLDTIDDFLDTEIAAILAAVDTEVADILTDTGTTLPAQISALFTTALTESYRSTGATGTPAQLLYEILSNLVEFANSGTTRTAKKLDGSTTAKTYTYDDAATPTSITETT